MGEAKNLLHRLTVAKTSKGMINYPKRGLFQTTWPLYKLSGCCIFLEHVSLSPANLAAHRLIMWGTKPTDDKLPQKALVPDAFDKISDISVKNYSLNMLMALHSKKHIKDSIIIKKW